MVSIAQTSKKYRGRKAETYDAIRSKQQRWALENDAVEQLLPVDITSVLDCPVGTGRFIPLYAKRKITVIGVDASEEMLRLARKKKMWSGRLVLGDATDLSEGSGQDNYRFEADAVVCVRFLDLIDQDAMYRVMKELMRVARRHVVLTIRLGDEYVPKVNTATHSRKAFLRLVSVNGWKVDHMIPIFKAGWMVVRLGRK